MIKQIHWDDEKLVYELYNLQRVAYVIEAEIIGSMDLPPLKETFDQFQSCHETFFGWFENKGELAGAVSVTINGEVLTICRLVVHPTFLRNGIGSKLLGFINNRYSGVKQMNVATGRDNTPATNLYLKHDFEIVKDQEVEPGLFIRLFTKTNRSSKSNKKFSP